MGETHDYNIDLESLNQKGSVPRPQSFRSIFNSRNSPGNASSLHRTGSRLSTVSERRSVISERTRNSLRYLSNLRLPEQPSPQPVVVDENLDDQAREEFFVLIRGKRASTDSLEDACRWYSGFLESKFEEVWIPLLRSCLFGLDAGAVEMGRGDLAIVYKFMKAVAEKLMHKENIALVDVVDSVANLGYLKDEEFSEDEEHDLPEERALPNQLAFAALGWLSQLYSPRPDQDPGKLQISKDVQTSREATPLTSRSFTTFEQGFDYSNQPFYQLLRKFGDLIPEFKGEIRSAFDWGNSGAQPNEYIEHAHVRFHTLINVAKVKIEWVDALSLHFQFDSRNRTLRLFRFPSFCRIMYSDRGETLLSMLFNDHSTAMNPQLQDERDHTGDFFKEVLLSYRLIFGQHKKSWQYFNKKLVAWNHDWDCSGEQGSRTSDPMLLLLCGRSWLADGPKQIYDEISADEPSEYYSPNMDFPFLGKRILVLQNHVKGHNAHSLRALWHDHRNVSWWWTFWAVVFLGIITVVLAILSLVFSIWQVALAQKSYALSQSQSNNS